ncbi:right-handed parallel beta-helix repeat-containing protein [Morganella morganii]|uniref:right-handed parallel beta-helix repeat-containing protein n=1 Tax=Morganella morganii TaxID=582 RepID=UPI0006999148|nr:right-handed parallel beta-helix repeat-containing protein [Morganella morganii]
MTVSTELSHEEYTGNGVTTDFDFRFRIFEAKHLVVSVADPDGTERILTNGTDYTLRGVGSYRGGKVILKMPLATGWKIGIARDLPVVQETDLRNQGKFFAEVHEDAFDYLTMLIQKSLGFLSLCLRKPSFISDHYDAKGNKISNLGKPVKDGDAVDLGTMKEHISAKDKRSLRVADKDIPALPDAANRANKLLSFDNNGNPVVIVPESGSAADVLAELGKPDGVKLLGRCHNLTELRSTEPVSHNQLILLESVSDSRIIGSSSWYHDDSDHSTEDNGIWCVVTSGGKRWKICNFDKITSQMMGLEQGAGSDSKSQSAKIQKGLDCARVYKDSDWEGHAHYPVILGGGTFRIDEILRPRRVPLIGSGQGGTTLFTLNCQDDYCLFFEHDIEYQGMGPELRDIAIYGHPKKGVFFNTAGVNMSKVSLSNMGQGMNLNSASDIVIDSVVYDQVQIGLRMGYCKNAVITNQVFFLGGYGIFIEEANTQISLNNITFQYYNVGVVFAGSGNDVSISNSSFLLNGPQSSDSKFGGFVSMAHGQNKLKLSNCTMRNPHGYAVRIVGTAGTCVMINDLFISGKPNVPDHGRNKGAGILCNDQQLIAKNITFDEISGYMLESTSGVPVDISIDGISETSSKSAVDVPTYFNITNTHADSTIEISGINFDIEKDLYDASVNKNSRVNINYQNNKLSFFRKGAFDTIYTRFPVSANRSYLVKVSNSTSGTFIVSLDTNTGNTALNIIKLKDDPSISFYIGDHHSKTIGIDGRILTHFISVGWHKSNGEQALVTVTSI